MSEACFYGGPVCSWHLLLLIAILKALLWFDIVLLIGLSLLMLLRAMGCVILIYVHCVFALLGLIIRLSNAVGSGSSI